MSKQITVKQASELTKKSIHTIRKLLINNKIKSTKIPGKNGLEIRIDEDELKRFYNLQTNTNNDINNTSAFYNNNPNDIYEGNLGKEMFDILRSENENLRLDKEKLFKELETRGVELEKMQRLLENQQILTKDIQNQFQLSSGDSKNSKNSKNDSVDISKQDQKSNDKKPKQKKFFGLF